MSDDIVTRLRNSYGQGCTCFAHHSFECSCVGAQWVERYVDEAADEIERLRTALQLAVGELSTHDTHRLYSPDQLYQQFLEEARRG